MKPQLVAIAYPAIEFYYKDGDNKMSFRVKGNKELTNILLRASKTKRINPLDISYCITGIKKKITEERIFDLNPSPEAPRVNKEPSEASEEQLVPTPISDYTSELNRQVQRRYGKSITTEVVDSNTYSTTVLVVTPFGTYRGEGKNKVIAKAIAAQKALEELKKR